MKFLRCFLGGMMSVPEYKHSFEKFNFEYDVSVSYEQNFDCWYELNCRERESFGEKKYSILKARLVFESFLKQKYPSFTIKID